MKGWLYQGVGVAPKLIEKETPKAGYGEVLLDIKASGLCHSDVAALESENSPALYMKPPLVFGHECAGQIIEVGEGVTEWKVGDRVGVCPVSPTDPSKMVGYTRDGGYATHCVVPADQCVALPEGVTYMQGAAGTDAGATSHRALFVHGKLKEGMKVGIIGVGGLGQFGVAMAVIAGCEVYAVDPKEYSREFALKAGCKAVYADAKELAGMNLNVVIDFAGFNGTLTAAINAVGFGGTVVNVGGGDNNITLNKSTMTNKEITLVASRGNTKNDIKGVYDFYATGRLNTDLHTISFDEIGEGLERLKSGAVTGRLVAVQE